MTDREELLNNLTGDTPAPEEVTPPAEDTPDPVSADVDPPAEVDEPEPAHKQTLALLDELTGEKPAEEEAAPVADKPAEPAKPVEPEAPKTLDQEEAEALASVKSERGQERIKATFTKLRETEARAAQHEGDVKEFREMVLSTGANAQEFGQMLEVVRLMKSGNDADKRMALEQIEQQRAMLCKELGIEAPGVDVLADFPELKQAVENMEITPAYAHQLAKVKRQEAQAAQQQRQVQASQQDQQQFLQSVDQVSKVAESYFDTKKAEADYPAKMKMIHEKFKDPVYMQEFVTTYEPKQWFGIFKLMYDGMVVQAPTQPPRQQPIRSGARPAGTPSTSGVQDISSRIMSHIDSL